jgi:ABC-type lipoprotein export system ATPase subunit
LPARTALDNVMLGPLSQGATLAQARAAGEDALARLDLMHLRSVRAGKLSGGELQRVCFARAVSAGLPCVFADEPSSNLDGNSTRVLAAAFQALAHRDVCLVIATHDPYLVAAAADVVKLREGL